MADDAIRRDSDLEEFRDYLLVLARGKIPTDLRGRLDASDVVQETLFEAHRKRAQFRGTEANSLGAWLRSLLAFTLIDAIRSQYRDKRDLRREQQIRDSLEQSSLKLANLIQSEDTSPSDRFDRQEHAARIASALQCLPVSQREAVLQRYCESRSLNEIAIDLDKTPVAVAGLLKRGLARLRVLLAEPQG